jgi:hypothetical protein
MFLIVVSIGLLIALRAVPELIDYCGYRRQVAARMRGEPIPPTPPDF